MKKARLFWSYRIEKTEQWLSQMASDGYHLTSINPILRSFSFQEGPSTATTYAIQYEKNNLTSGLLASGWDVATTSGKWRILKNESPEITTRPMRDGILKRTRLHAYIFLILSTLWLISPISFLFHLGNRQPCFDRENYDNAYVNSPHYFLVFSLSYDFHISSLS